MEYCSKGEFFGYLQNAAFAIDVARHYFKQLIDGTRHSNRVRLANLISFPAVAVAVAAGWTGVHFIHSKNVCHRDLSLENLLMDEKQVLKICDFGVAIECARDAIMTNTDPNRRPGKYRYMAPEVFAFHSYDPRKIDLWSCGVILFVMLLGAFPFELPVEADERFRYQPTAMRPSLPCLALPVCLVTAHLLHALLWWW